MSDEKTCTDAGKPEDPSAATPVTLPLPQRYRYQDYGSDQWFFGCVFPANPSKYDEDWIMLASLDGKVETCATDNPGGELQAFLAAGVIEWIDHDYAWSK